MLSVLSFNNFILAPMFTKPLTIKNKIYALSATSAFILKPYLLSYTFFYFAKCVVGGGNILEISWEDNYFRSKSISFKNVFSYPALEVRLLVDWLVGLSVGLLVCRLVCWAP